MNEVFCARLQPGFFCGRGGAGERADVFLCKRKTEQSVLCSDVGVAGGILPSAILRSGAGKPTLPATGGVGLPFESQYM